MGLGPFVSCNSKEWLFVVALKWDFFFGVIDVQWVSLSNTRTMAAVNQGAGGGVSEWISNIPFVTRYYFLGALGMTLAGNFGLIPSYYLVWSFDFFLQKFHIWRAFTAFLFMGGLGFPFLMNMSFLYRYSGLLERTYFGSNSADYIYMLLLCSLALLVNLAPLFPLRSKNHDLVEKKLNTCHPWMSGQSTLFFLLQT